MYVKDQRVLELGSGVGSNISWKLLFIYTFNTGLVGIVAAHLCKEVVLTDMDLDSLDLLQVNVDKNKESK